MNAAKNIELALVAVAAALAVTLAIASPGRATAPTRDDIGSIPYNLMRVNEQFTRIPRPAPPKEIDERTAREQVFRVIAAGRSNADIAQELFISDTTVGTHVTHIFQKLELRDRAQAVVLASQTGLFETDAPQRAVRAESTTPEVACRTIPHGTTNRVSPGARFWGQVRGFPGAWGSSREGLVLTERNAARRVGLVRRRA